MPQAPSPKPQATARDRFVNPYTFVPLPTTVVRRPPPGHIPAQGLGTDRARLSGTITVQWTLHTPLLLPATATEEGWLRPDGALRIPGSSMKGAIRSLHETLFHGCLRVFDADFLPVYRLPVSSGSHDADAWTLGVVTVSQAGTPIEIQPCTGVEWVESTSLKVAYAPRVHRLPQTGDFVTVGGQRRDSDLRGAPEVPHVASVGNVSRPTDTTVGDRKVLGQLPTTAAGVLLVTDTQARDPKPRRDGTPAQCFWAVGVLGSEPSVQVSDVTARLFREVSDGTRDRQAAIASEKRGGSDDWRRKATFERVQWRGADVGKRAIASGYLHAGDVVWIRRSGSPTQIEEIRLSRVWRGKGRYAAGTRVPPDLLPCCSSESVDRATDSVEPVTLCLSCAVFGSADTTGDRAGRGRQDAYAGHVSVGSARSAGTVSTQSVDLAPLSSPRLGSGMFTLRSWNPSDAPGKVAEHWGSVIGTSDVPEDVASHWGSALDGDDPPTPRALRGRKFYRHVDSEAQAAFWTRALRRDVKPRHEARSDGSVSRQDAVLVLPTQTPESSPEPTALELEQEITFEGLDEVALATLLVAIEPGRLLGKVRSGGTFATHLGGGKPFGLGAATATIVSLKVENPGQRYLGSPDQHFDDSAAFPLSGVQARVGRLSHLPMVANVLDLDGLGEWRYHVAYPPGATWDEVDVEDDRHNVIFDQSFHFFSQVNGERLERENRPWHPLPALTATEPTRPDLPIFGRRTKRPRQDAARRGWQR